MRSKQRWRTGMERKEQGRWRSNYRRLNDGVCRLRVRGILRRRRCGMKEIGSPLHPGFRETLKKRGADAASAASPAGGTANTDSWSGPAVDAARRSATMKRQD
jgi:hypothetical protein